MSKVDFWIKYVYLDWIRWNLEVVYVMALKNDVVWILPKWVDDKKFHKWSKDVVFIYNPSKWVYGSSLSVYVKKIIEKSVSLIMKWFLSVLAKTRQW